MKSKLIAGLILMMAVSLTAHGGTELTTDTKEMVTPPSLRSDAGFYVGVYGGAQFATGYGNQRQTFTGTSASAAAIGVPPGTTIVPSSSISSGWGGAGGIKAGYNFESFGLTDALRLQPGVEAEALYLGTTSTSSGSFLGASGSSSTSYNSAAWFLNGILRLKTGTLFTPYIGAGVGGEYLSLHSDAVVPAVGAHFTGITGDDVDFAGQAFAGFDIALNDHWSLFSEYKFIDALGTDVKVSNFGGTGLDYRFKPDQIQQHLVVAGLKYTF